MDGSFNYSKSVFVITKSNGCFNYYFDFNSGSFDLANNYHINNWGQFNTFWVNLTHLGQFNHIWIVLEQ